MSSEVGRGHVLLAAYCRSVRHRSVLLLMGAVLLCVALRPGDFGLLAGLALGGGFSLVKFSLSCRQALKLERLVPRPAGAAAGAGMIHRFATFAATAAVLLVAFATPQLNGLAAAGGLLLTNVVVISDGWRHAGGAHARRGAQVSGGANRAD